MRITPSRSALLRGFGVVALIVIAMLVAAGTSPAHAVALTHQVPHFGPDSLLVSLMGLTGSEVTYGKVADLNKSFRRGTTKLYRTRTRRVAEYRMMDDIPDEEITPSGRENLIPLDVAIGVGAHQMTDSGHEGRTETQDLAEASFIYNETSSRFSISLFAKVMDRKARGNQIISQIKLKSLQCIEAVMRKKGYMFYGTSSGVLAKIDGNPGAGTSSTLTLKDAFGIGGLTDAAYLAGMFPTDEGVAIIRGGVLIGMGIVTGQDEVAGTIDVDWNDNIDPADGDELVYANGVIGATLDETDYGKWNEGLLGAAINDEVHGLATSNEPTWGPAQYGSDGGSFGFLLARRWRQALENKGDTTLRKIILSNGVQNDKDARERQALIWTSSSAMNIDGAASIKGVTEVTTRFVPPTCAFGIGADAIGKSVLTEKPDEEDTIDFGQLYKAEDRGALKGGIHIVDAVIFRSRRRIVAETGLDEQ